MQKKDIIKFDLSEKSSEDVSEFLQILFSVRYFLSKTGKKLKIERKKSPKIKISSV